MGVRGPIQPNDQSDELDKASREDTTVRDALARSRGQARRRRLRFIPDRSPARWTGERSTRKLS